MKEHPKDCPGDICDEYNCENRKRVLQNNFHSWSGVASSASQASSAHNPQEIKACLNCNPHQARSPSARCGKINQFCKNPFHDSVVCIPDSFIPKTWKWTERETEHLGEFEKNRFLFDYHKLKVNFAMCGYPPTPTTQWAPCNTDWQLLRNENATMHYIGGRTRVTLRVWCCSHPRMCCTLNVNGMEDGFFNFDNRNLFECEFLDMLLDRIHSKNVSIPAAFHELSNEFEICHDDMPGLPVRTWVSVLDSYRAFVGNKSEYTSASQAIRKMILMPPASLPQEKPAAMYPSSESLIQSFPPRLDGGPETNRGSSVPSPVWLNYSPSFSSHAPMNLNLSDIVDSINPFPAFSKKARSWDYLNEGEVRSAFPLQLQLPAFYNATLSHASSSVPK